MPYLELMSKESSILQSSNLALVEPWQVMGSSLGICLGISLECLLCVVETLPKDMRCISIPIRWQDEVIRA